MADELNRPEIKNFIEAFVEEDIGSGGQYEGNDVRTPEHPAIANHLEVCEHLFQNGDALMLQLIV